MTPFPCITKDMSVIMNVLMTLLFLVIVSVTLGQHLHVKKESMPTKAKKLWYAYIVADLYYVLHQEDNRYFGIIEITKRNVYFLKMIHQKRLIPKVTHKMIPIGRILLQYNTNIAIHPSFKINITIIHLEQQYLNYVQCKMNPLFLGVLHCGKSTYDWQICGKYNFPWSLYTSSNTCKLSSSKV